MTFFPLTQSSQYRYLWLIFNAMNSQHGRTDQAITIQWQKNKKTNVEETEDGDHLCVTDFWD